MPTLQPAPLAAPPPKDSRRDLALAVLLGGLTVGAWAALWAWSASPYARYAAHDGWLDSAAFAALCRALPAGSIVVPAALYALAWVLMIAAMMLPTTYPVLGIFRVMTRARRDARRLLALVVAGFFGAWFAFGLLAHGLDGAVAWLGGRSLWLIEHGWAAGAAVLAAAGLFQFSALKYRCLDECRSPLGFVLNRWQGLAPGREALRLGVAHGLFCVGCCWSLMFVQFGVGLGSLGWMLVIGTLTAIEKNSRWGRQIGRPLGVALLVAGLAVLNG